jgi:hypothetical protein
MRVVSGGQTGVDRAALARDRHRRLCEDGRQ